MAPSRSVKAGPAPTTSSWSAVLPDRSSMPEAYRSGRSDQPPWLPLPGGVDGRPFASGRVLGRGRRSRLLAGRLWLRSGMGPRRGLSAVMRFLRWIDGCRRGLVRVGRVIGLVRVGRVIGLVRCARTVAWIRRGPVRPRRACPAARGRPSRFGRWRAGSRPWPVRGRDRAVPSGPRCSDGPRRPTSHSRRDLPFVPAIASARIEL